MSKWFKSRNIINITTLPWLQGVNFDVHGFINIPNVFLGMNEIHKKCNGSRYWSSNLKTSESGSSKDLVGLKGNYPYPKNTHTSTPGMCAGGWIPGGQISGFCRIFFLFDFAKVPSCFFQPWIQVLGFFWTKTQKKEKPECPPPQKKKQRQEFSDAKTAFYTKQLLHLKSCCFYIKNIYNRKSFIYTKD